MKKSCCMSDNFAICDGMGMCARKSYSNSINYVEYSNLAKVTVNCSYCELQTDITLNETSDTFCSLPTEMDIYNLVMNQDYVSDSLYHCLKDNVQISVSYKQKKMLKNVKNAERNFRKNSTS